MGKIEIKSKTHFLRRTLGRTRTQGPTKQPIRIESRTVTFTTHGINTTSLDKERQKINREIDSIDLNKRMYQQTVQSLVLEQDGFTVPMRPKNGNISSKPLHSTNYVIPQREQSTCGKKLT